MAIHCYGKVRYSVITTIDSESVWCYSHAELQELLTTLCRGQILKKVYASLSGYLESMRHDKNYYDFSYFGGGVVLLFDTLAVELFVHAMGMMQYRILDLRDIQIRETKGFPPREAWVSDDTYYYDLSEQFALSFTDKTVLEVVVDATNCYPFSLEGFDTERAVLAEQQNCLPENIHFKLDNGVDLGLYGDCIEWFYIELKVL